jgi:hypothetical protein
LNVDGLACLGNSNIITDGNTGSNNSPCSSPDIVLMDDGTGC